MIPLIVSLAEEVMVPWSLSSTSAVNKPLSSVEMSEIDNVCSNPLSLTEALNLLSSLEIASFPFIHLTCLGFDRMTFSETVSCSRISKSSSGVMIEHGSSRTFKMESKLKEA